MSKIVTLSVDCMDENYGEPITASVEITPSLATLILKRMDTAKRLFEEDGSLFNLEYWNCDIEYKFKDPDAPDGDVSTELDTMLVTTDNVHWEAYLKHTNVVLSTDYIHRPALEEMAKEFGL